MSLSAKPDFSNHQKSRPRGRPGKSNDIDFLLRFCCAHICATRSTRRLHLHWLMCVLDGLLQDVFAGHHYTHVDHLGLPTKSQASSGFGNLSTGLEVVAAQDNSHDVLANVVHISFHRCLIEPAHMGRNVKPEDAKAGLAISTTPVYLG